MCDSPNAKVSMTSGVNPDVSTKMRERSFIASNPTSTAQSAESIPSPKAVTQESAPAISSEPVIPYVEKPNTPDLGQSSVSKFDPEGTDYDYETAKRNGMSPSADNGHWGSVAPASKEDVEKYKLPDGSYVILKGKNHESWGKAVSAENDRGYEVKKFGDRYYSVPRSNKWTPPDSLLGSNGVFRSVAGKNPSDISMSDIGSLAKDVSYDLRTPFRKIAGVGDDVLEAVVGALPDASKISNAAQPIIKKDFGDTTLGDYGNLVGSVAKTAYDASPLVVAFNADKNLYKKWINPDEVATKPNQAVATQSQDVETHEKPKETVDKEAIARANLEKEFTKGSLDVSESGALTIETVPDSNRINDIMEIVRQNQNAPQAPAMTVQDYIKMQEAAKGRIGDLKPVSPYALRAKAAMATTSVKEASALEDEATNIEAARDAIPSSNGVSLRNYLEPSNLHPTPVQKTPATPIKTSQASPINAGLIVAREFEGPEPTDGAGTEYGLGQGNAAGISVRTPEDAAVVYEEKYMNNPKFPLTQKIAQQITDPNERVVFMQYAVNRPAYLEEFLKRQIAGNGETSGPRFLNAMLYDQERNYRTKPFDVESRYNQALINRVNKASEYLKKARKTV